MYAQCNNFGTTALLWPLHFQYMNANFDALLQIQDGPKAGIQLHVFQEIWNVSF
jgi:hypothetical protein